MLKSDSAVEPAWSANSPPQSTALRMPADVARTSAADAACGSLSVVTHMDIPADINRLWEALHFYEEIERRPPVLLKLLLPLPLRTEGRKSNAGDTIRCVYKSGQLVKRITQLTVPTEYRFEVIEQQLKVGHGIRLLGGNYRLRELARGITRVSLETSYTSSMRPRWLFGPIERLVCHSFHRFILRTLFKSVAHRRTNSL